MACPSGAHALPECHPCVVSEAPMERSRVVRGAPVGCSWGDNGSPMGRPWVAREAPMGCPWLTHGLFAGHS